MSSNRNRDVVEKYIAGLSVMDVDAMTSLTHPDSIFDWPQTRERIKGMMNGVPLMQEGYVERNYGSKEHGDSAVRYTSRDSTQPVSIDRPDARIQYGLQEEQHRAEFDRRVQQEYIREFVENARRDGVKVVLDQDANVISAEPLNPGDRGANSRTPGSTDPTVGR